MAATMYSTDKNQKHCCKFLILILCFLGNSFASAHCDITRKGTSHCTAFTLRMTSAEPPKERSKRKEIYGIHGSGWASPDWNWGYASGTGHDCAMICRNKWGTRQSRISLVENLLNPKSVIDHKNIWESDSQRDPEFEEVKLILALAWQRGRWDGSDGGRNGYSKILSLMAKAYKYEPQGEGYEFEEACSRALVTDMKDAFHTIAQSKDEATKMTSIDIDSDDVDASRRKCAGLVLQNMGFIDKGL